MQLADAMLSQFKGEFRFVHNASQYGLQVYGSLFNQTLR